jgi:hypothetical protein
MKTFRIPFNEKIYKNQAEIYLNHRFKKKIKDGGTRALIMAIVFLICGIAWLPLIAFMGHFCLILGALLMIGWLTNNLGYKKTRKTFYEALNKECIARMERNDVCVWEFTEDHFYYADYKMETRLIWPAFKNILKIENNIYLEADVGITFMLSDEEVGMEAFNEILSLVETKTGLSTAPPKAP